mgnify:CR=1 FL=1
MSISCSNCGFAFEKEDHTKPCPKCGSHNRNITLVEEIRSHELSKLGKKGPSSPKRRHKFDQEIVTGEKVGKDGKAVSIERIIDREQDVYRETVEDEHGQIKVKKHERLSEHR